MSSNIDAINHVKDTIFYILKTDYLPTQVEKQQLIQAFTPDMSVDMAESINFINNSVSSVALAYGSVVQKAYMVMQVLEVLKAKDEKYKNFYLGDIYANKSLKQGLNDGTIEAEARISSFVDYIKNLYILNKAELIRNLTNVYVTAGALGETGTIEKSINHCEIVNFVPLTTAITVECSAKKPEKRSDYAYRFSAKLGPLYKNGHITPNIVNFIYGEGVADENRFQFNYTNPITDRGTADQYFSKEESKQIWYLDPYYNSGNSGGYPTHRWFNFKLAAYTTEYALEGKSAVRYNCKNHPFTPHVCNYATTSIIFFSLTGNFVFVNKKFIENSWAFGGVTAASQYYISAINTDNTELEQTELVPKYTTQPDRPYAVQQAFSTGAVLVMETSDGFSTYHPDTLGYHDQTSIYTYNPLQIEIKLKNANEKVSVSLGGDWLQYCDRRDSKVVATTQAGVKGWELETMCHSNIDKSDDFRQAHIFISQEIVQEEAERAMRKLKISYEPREKLLKF